MEEFNFSENVYMFSVYYIITTYYLPIVTTVVPNHCF